MWNIEDKSLIQLHVTGSISVRLKAAISHGFSNARTNGGWLDCNHCLVVLCCSLKWETCIQILIEELFLGSYIGDAVDIFYPDIDSLQAKVTLCFATFTLPLIMISHLTNSNYVQLTMCELPLVIKFKQHIFISQLLTRKSYLIGLKPVSGWACWNFFTWYICKT